MPDKIYSNIDGKWVEIGHEDHESPMREHLINCLEDMETCTRICEIESKSWHDFWVVQRALVKAMWFVLTWIVKQMAKKE